MHGHTLTNNFTIASDRLLRTRVTMMSPLRWIEGLTIVVVFRIGPW